MKYNIISTGSHGNAVIINDFILVDCGVSFKELKDVYKDIKIVLLTHIHNDHFKKSTIKKLALERPTLRFACCEWLLLDLLSCEVPKHNIDVLEIDKVYNYGVFRVSPIRLYHDVPQCGYRLFIGDKKAIYATDTANLDGITAKGYDLYLIEGNYTEEDLRTRIKTKKEAGKYSYEMDASKRHLSKEQALEFLFENMGKHSEYVFLHKHIDKSNVSVR